MNSRHLLIGIESRVPILATGWKDIKGPIGPESVRKLQAVETSAHIIPMQIIESPLFPSFLNHHKSMLFFFSSTLDVIRQVFDGRARNDDFRCNFFLHRTLYHCHHDESLQRITPQIEEIIPYADRMNP
jgi:hypothetical protein